MFGPKLYNPPVAFHFSVKIVDSLTAPSTDGMSNKDKFNAVKDKVGKMAIDKIGSATGLLPAMDGRFQEVSGFSATLDMSQEVKEAGNNTEVIKLPGRITYSPLVLKRGLVVMKTELGVWIKAIIENNYATQIKRRHLVVSLLNQNNVPLMSWGFENAFPVKWELSPMNAMDNQLSFETIEIFYSKLVIMESVYDKVDGQSGVGGKIKASLGF